MLEVEMKFKVSDLSALRERLLALGAQLGETRNEADQYFNAPDRDFAQTDEAVRLRRIGERNILTYKGPKLDAQTKTRTEIEVPLADGPAAADQLARLLTFLRYRPVALIAKRRTLFHLDVAGFPVEICLDEAEGVGTFVELEVQAEEADLDRARQAILDLAKRLSLKGSERRSYLEMWLEKHRR